MRIFGKIMGVLLMGAVIWTAYESGYFRHEAPAVPAETTAAQTTAAEETPAETTAAQTTAAAEAPASEPAQIVFDHLFDSGLESARVTAYSADGSVMWTYAAESYPMTELDSVREIGCRDNAYYLVEGGKVVVLRKTDGQLIWECKPGQYGCGASNSFCFDEDGSLYISGYYGPDMTKIDRHGQLLWMVESYEGYMWFHNISYAGGVIECFATTMDSRMEDVSVRLSAANGEMLTH